MGGVIGFIVVIIIAVVIIKKIAGALEDSKWKKQQEDEDRKRSEFERRAAEGDPDAIKKLIEMGTEIERVVMADGGFGDGLLNDAEKRTFEIIQNVIIKHGGMSDFKPTAAAPLDIRYYQVSKKWFESSKGDRIWLTFSVAPMEGSPPTSAIKFYLLLKLPPEIIPAIAKEAEQGIKDYLISKGLPLRT